MMCCRRCIRILVEYQRLALRMRCGSSLAEHTLLTVMHSNSTVDSIDNRSASNHSPEEDDIGDVTTAAAIATTTTNVLNDPLPACPITLISSPSDINMLEVSIVTVSHKKRSGTAVVTLRLSLVDQPLYSTMLYSSYPHLSSHSFSRFVIISSTRPLSRYRSDDGGVHRGVQRHRAVRRLSSRGK